MPGYWHLREVLSVDPGAQTSCVGQAYKGTKNQRRCEVNISGTDLITASRLLDQIDRSKKIAPGDLEELAAFLLCKNFHNSQEKPHLNQIAEVSGMWNKKVAAAKREMARREMEKPEMLEAEKLLAERTDGVKKVRDGSKLEVREKVHQARPVQSKMYVPTKATIDDPFETRASSSARPNIFTTQSAPPHNAQDTGFLPNDFPIAPNRELPAEGENLGLHLGMPSPPMHEPSPTKTAKIAVAEKQETTTTNQRLDNNEESMMSRFTFTFGSVPDFQFETPTKVKITQAETPPSPVPTNVMAFPRFCFGGSTSTISLVSTKQKPLEELKRVPLQERAAHPINVPISDKRAPFPYEFGSGGKTPSRPFEFEAPLKFQPPSRIDDTTTRLAVLFEVTPHEDDESKISSSTSTLDQPSKQPEVSNPRSATPNNDPQYISNRINQIPARPSTTPAKNEESFGHANITPDSTRYTTYLPARQQHGLITPPETPEMLLRSLSKPMETPGYPKDSSPKETGSPAPKVVRKPLLSSPPARADDVGKEREKACFRYCSSAAQSAGDRPCGESEVQSGCLARLSLRELKGKVKGQLKEVRRSLLRAKENS